MMGTGPFAVPVFQSLLDSNHEVVSLITRPVPPARKRSKTPPNPMLDLGKSVGIEIYDPASIKSPEAIARLQQWNADLLVVCDYGQILSKEALMTAHLGGINLHGSILPRYRGAAPVNWAIYHGDQETGVTVIHMSPRLDAGNCIVVSRAPIDPDEDAVELETKLAALGPQAVDDAIAQLQAWDGETLIGEPQDEQLATKAPRLKKTDGVVDWTQSAQQIKNQIRAFQPWPGSYTFWQRPSGQPLRVILNQVSIADEDNLDLPEGQQLDRNAAAGTVVVTAKNQLVVMTGEGLLSIDMIQPSGKRSFEVGEFLRGYPIKPGEQFCGEIESSV